MNSTKLAEAFSKYQKFARDAVRFSNKNWTSDAFAREQHKRLQAPRQ